MKFNNMYTWNGDTDKNHIYYAHTAQKYDFSLHHAMDIGFLKWGLLLKIDISHYTIITSVRVCVCVRARFHFDGQRYFQRQ